MLCFEVRVDVSSDQVHPKVDVVDFGELPADVLIYTFSVLCVDFFDCVHQLEFARCHHLLLLGSGFLLLLLLLSCIFFFLVPIENVVI